MSLSRRRANDPVQLSDIQDICGKLLEKVSSLLLLGVVCGCEVWKHSSRTAIMREGQHQGEADMAGDIIDTRRKNLDITELLNQTNPEAHVVIIQGRLS